MNFEAVANKQRYTKDYLGASVCWFISQHSAHVRYGSHDRWILLSGSDLTMLTICVTFNSQLARQV